VIRVSEESVEFRLCDFSRWKNSLFIGKMKVGSEIAAELHGSYRKDGVFESDFD